MTRRNKSRARAITFGRPWWLPLAATLAAAALVGSATPAPAQSANVILECSSCHTNSQASAEPPAVTSPFPDLSGQPARYIAHQLHAYRLGLRQHRQMQQTATALGAGGAGAMARLYADAPRRKGEQASDPGDNPAGHALAVEGAWERGVPPCASCHGVSVEKTGRLAPILYGHDAGYLAHELRAYASGQRRSDTMGRMRTFAAQLTQAEIDAVAEYYASFAQTGDEQ